MASHAAQLLGQTGIFAREERVAELVGHHEGVFFGYAVGRPQIGGFKARRGQDARGRGLGLGGLLNAQADDVLGGQLVLEVGLAEQLVVVLASAEVQDDELGFLGRLGEKFVLGGLPFDAGSLPAFLLASRLRRTGATGTSGTSTVGSARQEALRANGGDQGQHAADQLKFHHKSFSHRDKC
jgi:hypothetical protein